MMLTRKLVFASALSFIILVTITVASPIPPTSGAAFEGGVGNFNLGDANTAIKSGIDQLLGGSNRLNRAGTIPSSPVSQELLKKIDNTAGIIGEAKPAPPATSGAVIDNGGTLGDANNDFLNPKSDLEDLSKFSVGPKSPVFQEAIDASNKQPGLIREAFD